ncbi:VanZ family protein [Agromyces sp. ZXT2-3]|uniref:VanZ family protein n=1 Tax=Agromyces sp. ZXT2-3 TaxID=3461152 RepID=UPI004054F87A
MRPSRAAAVLLFAYAVVVMWLTLGPAPGAVYGNQAPGGVLDPGIWFDADTWAIGSRTEFELNVLLFVPFGALLAFAVRGAPPIVPAAMAAGFALLIEIAQIPMADRISDPRDLVANSLGAVIGILIARISDAIAGIPNALRARRRAALARSVARTPTGPLSTFTSTGSIPVRPGSGARGSAASSAPPAPPRSASADRSAAGRGIR